MQYVWQNVVVKVELVIIGGCQLITSTALGTDQKTFFVFNVCRYCHCVVMDYKTAQPTQQELDAYWTIFGEDMKIPIESDTHTCRWGN